MLFSLSAIIFQLLLQILPKQVGAGVFVLFRLEKSRADGRNSFQNHITDRVGLPDGITFEPVKGEISLFLHEVAHLIEFFADLDLWVRIALAQGIPERRKRLRTQTRNQQMLVVQLARMNAFSYPERTAARD